MTAKQIIRESDRQLAANATYRERERLARLARATTIGWTLISGKGDKP